MESNRDLEFQIIKIKIHISSLLTELSLKYVDMSYNLCFLLFLDRVLFSLFRTVQTHGNQVIKLVYIGNKGFKEIRGLIEAEVLICLRRRRCLG